MLFIGMLSATHADGILSPQQQAKPYTVAYDRLLADGHTRLQVRNIADGGFLLMRGSEVLGFSDTGSFQEETAPPALLDMLEALRESESREAVSVSYQSAVQPLLGSIAWNQDSPYNDLCPLYDMNTRCVTGCVATAMAQVMRYHQWPLQGTGQHSYEPAVMSGNTLSADFGATTYLWDAMLPNYQTATMPAAGYTMEECRQAVAQLMLHCGIAVDMVYYSSSGAADYDVPPALIDYFGYDRSIAYRKREHYSTADWLQLIHEELVAGRPVLAYGRATSGGHAFVFDGMDEQGFVHVNWGWGGMSNGYFNISALTPPSQGIGGSDGGFNYSQRIITGIRPVREQACDYDVELTSTEGLTAGKQKIAQGSDVTIRLSGKVKNHGWRDADFDYALLLLSSNGDTVRIIPGPASQTLAKDATDYAPTFGTVNFGTLAAGKYMLYPACRMTGGTGPWLRIRDNYIGYVNRYELTVTEADITFHQPDYFKLKAIDTEVPATIYSGMPTLITTTISNEGDVEYHGEVKAQLRKGNSIVSTTSNYIIDLQPGASTKMRFTDSFKADEDDYTLCLVDDDGSVISARIATTVKTAPATATVIATSPLTIGKALPHEMQAKATVASDGGIFGGMLYTYIFSEDGKTQLGCLNPEYIMLDENTSELQVVMTGSMENGIPGSTYQARLAVYDGSSYAFLSDANATTTFVFDPASGIKDCILDAVSGEQAVYDLGGRQMSRVGSHGQPMHGIVIVDGKKIIITKP